MTVAEEQDMAWKRAEPADHRIGSGTDVRHGFAARATIAEEIPAGPFEAHLSRAPALVRAIIPFGQVGDAHASIAEASQLTRPTRSLQRTNEDPIEGQTTKSLT